MEGAIDKNIARMTELVGSSVEGQLQGQFVYSELTEGK